MTPSEVQVPASMQLKTVIKLTISGVRQQKNGWYKMQLQPAVIFYQGGPKHVVGGCVMTLDHGIIEGHDFAPWSNGGGGHEITSLLIWYQFPPF